MTGRSIATWRWIVYALLFAAALLLARAGIEHRRHAAPPPKVETPAD